MPLETLYAIMRRVFGLRTFQFSPAMSSKDVPGWDSLNHTVLLMEIEAETGVELPAPETARLPTIGDLHRFINERVASRAGRAD